MITKSQKNLIILGLLIAVAIGILGIQQMLMLEKAHSTFENYYAFRGCAELLEKTDDYGICKTDSGETIKIVKFDNRWFLDGDLPCGFLCW